MKVGHEQGWQRIRRARIKEVHTTIQHFDKCLFQGSHKKKNRTKDKDTKN